MPVFRLSSTWRLGMSLDLAMPCMSESVKRTKSYSAAAAAAAPSVQSPSSLSDIGDAMLSTVTSEAANVSSRNGSPVLCMPVPARCHIVVMLGYEKCRLSFRFRYIESCPIRSFLTNRHPLFCLLGVDFILFLDSNADDK